MSRKQSQFEPDSFNFHSILSGFRAGVGEMIDVTAQDLLERGYDPERVIRAICSSLVHDAFGVVIVRLGLERTVKFLSSIVNERALSWRADTNPLGKSQEEMDEDE